MQTVSEKDTSEMTDTELCQRFDKDILFDTRDLRARLARSDAANAIKDRGRKVLTAVAQHLERNTELDKHELRLAWSLLLYQVQLELGAESGPTSVHDTAGWVAWARKQVGS